MEVSEKKLGEPGYVNKNCWLARNLGYPPSKHCQYCEIKLQNCLFSRYLIISSILAAILLAVSFYIERNITRSLIISIFTLVITYGYYFDKSTQKIIEASFAERKSKEALKELTDNLQEKVDEQTKELRESYEIEKNAKEELEHLDKVKNQFLLAIQHHLRTPLTSMIGYSDLLLGGSYGKQNKKTIEVIKRFQVSTASLIKMVNEFLDITQFQLGKNFIKADEKFDVCSIMREIIDDLSLSIKEKGIYLKAEKPKERCAVKADREKIKAALFNIIDNSVKYTDKGGIEIKMENLSQKVKIIIKDTGIGMSKENIKSLFDNVFQRGDKAKKVFVTGRGIGVYISSQIIKAHNGKIWAESDGEGKGSTFFIELPVDPDIAYCENKS